MKTNYQFHSERMNESVESNRFGREFINGNPNVLENIVEAEEVYNKSKNHVIFWQSGVMFLDGVKSEISFDDFNHIFNVKRQEWMDENKKSFGYFITKGNYMYSTVETMEGAKRNTSPNNHVVFWEAGKIYFDGDVFDGSLKDAQHIWQDVKTKAPHEQQAG